MCKQFLSSGWLPTSTCHVRLNRLTRETVAGCLPIKPMLIGRQPAILRGNLKLGCILAIWPLTLTLWPLTLCTVIRPVYGDILSDNIPSFSIFLSNIPMTQLCRKERFYWRLTPDILWYIPLYAKGMHPNINIILGARFHTWRRYRIERMKIIFCYCTEVACCTYVHYDFRSATKLQSYKFQ